MGAVKAVEALMTVVQNDWVEVLMALEIKDSSGEPLTEEFLREHLKVEAREAKAVRKKSVKGAKKEVVLDETCCSAAKHQWTGGDYGKARCGKSGCTRDDGNDNLLCEGCGSRWDTVSSNEIGGLVCYAVGNAAKTSLGGAEWLGIYGKDCPPVFMGQSCGILTKDGKWDMRGSMDKISKGGDRRKGAFHKPLMPWEVEGEDKAAETQMEEDATTVVEDADTDVETDASVKVDTASRSVIAVEPFPPIDEATDHSTFVLERAPYLQRQHGGKVFLYRDYGDDRPDCTMIGEASAKLKNDKIQWLDDEMETEHDDYVSSLDA